jgi:hypothetical protein
MFDRIAFIVSRCETDAKILEELAKADILESETEIADDVTLETFESEYMQVRK